ncbi:YkuS family protein [Desulfitobacterium sp.]|uniref:YkuS family protein n=1 Tax=Desulfitobacterium sp. TaxID=49981 RepID=UPI002C9608AD|nr:YkuS family protein [Desulfitobacterium sp.]HVJ48701.1 YkuS family protein [Desulfitobacterium sp.]
MYKKVAVEEGLSNVVQALHASGFHTTSLEGDDLVNVRAVIVKGDSTDILASPANLRVPIINASGRSAEEVVEVLRDRLS